MYLCIFKLLTEESRTAETLLIKVGLREVGCLLLARLPKFIIYIISFITPVFVYFLTMILVCFFLDYDLLLQIPLSQCQSELFLV